MHNRLESALYIKAGRRDPDVRKSLSASVRRTFDGMAHDAQMTLQWQTRSWPLPRAETRAIATSGQPSAVHPDAYRYLRGASYATDIAVCVVDSVRDVDPAVAYLLYEQRQRLQHLFVVTLENIPPDPRMLKEVDLPLCCRCMENGLYAPVVAASVCEAEQGTAAAAGYLSVHDARSLRRRSPIEYLMLARYRASSPL